MMVTIIVEARFEVDGTLRPMAFEWEGKRFIIESQGRQWEKDGIQYYMVMTTGEQVFELAYLLNENQWRLSRSPLDFKPRSIF